MHFLNQKQCMERYQEGYQRANGGTQNIGEIFLLQEIENSLEEKGAWYTCQKLESVDIYSSPKPTLDTHIKHIETRLGNTAQERKRKELRYAACVSYPPNLKDGDVGSEGASELPGNLSDQKKDRLSQRLSDCTVIKLAYSLKLCLNT